MVVALDNKASLEKTAVGLIGYGVSGRIFHAPFIATSSHAYLQAIASKKQEVITQAYPKVKIYDTPEALIDDPTIELVVIASPNTAHFSQAKLALEKKKHVVIDKPFTLNFKEAEILFSLADQNQCMLTAYHNRRWDSDFLTIQKVIGDGVLGEVVFFESCFAQWKPVNNKWKENSNDPGSGILLDIAPHLIDQAILLFGAPKTIITDTAILRENSQVPDYFQITLDYVTKKVILKSNHISHGQSHRFLIHGTQGSLICYGRDNQEYLIQKEIYPETDAWKLGKDTTVILHKNGVKTNIPIVPGCYTEFYNQLGKTVKSNGKILFPIMPNEIKMISQILDLACEIRC